jgi:hypothetical protein
MKKYLYSIIGTVLLFPFYVSDTLGIDIDTFNGNNNANNPSNVYRPGNLPAGTAATDMPVEAKINAVVNNVINLVLYASGGVAVFFLVLGAIRYITSLGNPERMDGAKKTIRFAVIGLLAVILAYAIVTNVINLIFKATV